MLALAGDAVTVAAGLAGWLLAGGAGSAHHARPQAGQAPVSASPTASQLAEVSQSALAGQSVSAVRQQLRQLGLGVQVTWRYNGHQQPGTVISVQPTGQLPAGTTVVVTGALAPPGHGNGQGNDNSGSGD